MGVSASRAAEASASASRGGTPRQQKEAERLQVRAGVLAALPNTSSPHPLGFMFIGFEG